MVHCIRASLHVSIFFLFFSFSHSHLSWSLLPLTSTSISRFVVFRRSIPYLKIRNYEEAINLFISHASHQLEKLMSCNPNIQSLGRSFPMVTAPSRSSPFPTALFRPLAPTLFTLLHLFENIFCPLQGLNQDSKLEPSIEMLDGINGSSTGSAALFDDEFPAALQHGTDFNNETVLYEESFLSQKLFDVSTVQLLIRTSTFRSLH